MTRFSSVLVVAALACLFFVSTAPAQETPENGEEAVQGEGESSPAEKTKWFRGSFEAGVDYRHSDRDSDVDMDQSLRFQIDPPKHERLRLRGSLWLNEDLDGDEVRSSVLRGINDASTSDVRARLLYLYLDVDDLWGRSTLRIGRQRMVEGVGYNRIDGLSFRQRHAYWNWYAFGGVRASIYDDAHNDPVLGGGVAYRPTPKTRLAVDLYYGEETRSRRDLVFPELLTRLIGLGFPRRVDKSVNDKAVALSAWHELTPNVRLYGRYIWKDGNGDELQLAATGYVPAWDLTYEVDVHSQLTTAGDGVNDLTSFFRILGEFKPYYNVLVALHYPLTEKMLLSLEAEFNESEEDDPFTANRDYGRVALILDNEDLFKGVDTIIALEHWSVTGGESTWSISGEVNREWKKFEMKAGVDFERYEDRFVRYNTLNFGNRFLGYEDSFVRLNLLPNLLEFAGFDLSPGIFSGFGSILAFLDTTIVETHENIYTFYTEGKWALTEDQDVTAGLTFEEDDGPDAPYWRIKAEYSIRF